MLCGELGSLAAEIACFSLTGLLDLEFNRNEFYDSILGGASMGGFLGYFYYWLGPKL